MTPDHIAARLFVLKLDISKLNRIQRRLVFDDVFIAFHGWTVLPFYGEGHHNNSMWGDTAKGILQGRGARWSGIEETPDRRIARLARVYRPGTRTDFENELDRANAAVIDLKGILFAKEALRKFGWDETVITEIIANFREHTDVVTDFDALHVAEDIPRSEYTFGEWIPLHAVTTNVPHRITIMDNSDIKGKQISYSDIDRSRIDCDGYPSDYALNAIHHFYGSPRELMDYVGEIWCGTGDVKITEPETEDGEVTIDFYCGGWSGNESIISELEDWTVFHRRFWVSESRGGAYVYSVPKAEWYTEQYLGSFRDNSAD